MELLNIQKEGSRYQEAVWELYEQAFPADEKKPRDLMEKLEAEGKIELLALVEDGTFAGLAMNMLHEEMALLDYLAISPEVRGGGYGGKAVHKLLERFRGKKYIYEIEMQDETAPNAIERRRRKAFYLRNGLKETGLFVNAYHTDFELLTPDGSLTFEEYVKMFHYILGEEGTRILNPHVIPGPKGEGGHV